MANPLPNLIVHRQNVYPNPGTELRNIFTIQSALVRGDKHVTLHNTNRVTAQDVSLIRVPYHPRTRAQDQAYEVPFRPPPPRNSPSGDPTIQPPIVGNFIDLLNWDGFRLEWVMVLGQGGYGMATLWNAIFEDGSSVKAVIKIPVRANTDFDRELAWHLRYAGASHVTQALDLQAMADGVRRRINRGHLINRGARFNPVNMSVLVLEYADRGSMFDMLNRASQYNIVFSNKVLWEIWECLVKGVVSVALQPDAARRWGHDGLDKCLDLLDDPDNINELHRVSTLINSHDVHFDLEEQNVLIAEDDHHGHHPIFKLHDFGEFSLKMREKWAVWQEGQYWRMRKAPKANRITPETIAREWDTFDPANLPPVSRFTGDSFRDPSKTVSAGRYGTWTNLYLIGKIMEAVITKLWVGHPMTTMRYRPSDLRADAETYGWRVCRTEYHWIDLDLRCLILQCQYEKPQDRPPLDYLLRKIAERKQRGFPEEDDTMTRQFWDLFWGMGRPAPVPNQAGSSDTSSSYANAGFQAAIQALGPQAPPVPPPPPPPPPQQPATNPYSSTGYNASGNPLISHVAALRLKSHRSPLISSSDMAGPSVRPAQQQQQQQQPPNPPSRNSLSAAVTLVGGMTMSNFGSTAPLLGQPAAGGASSEESSMRSGAATALRVPSAQGSSAQNNAMRPSAPMFGRPAADDPSSEESSLRPAATVGQSGLPPIAESSSIPDYFMRPTADGLPMPLRRPSPALGPSGEELPSQLGDILAQLARPPAADGPSGEDSPTRQGAAIAQAGSPAGEDSSGEESTMRATATVAPAGPPAGERSSSEEFPRRATAVQLGAPPAGEGSSGEEFPTRPGATVAQPGPSAAAGSSRGAFPMRPTAMAATTATKKRSAEEADEEAESTTSSQRKRQRRVRFDVSSASSTVTMGMLPVHLVETAADQSPGTLTRTWPEVANTPTHDPAIAVTDAPRPARNESYVEHMRSLHNQYDDPGLPETAGTGSKKKRSTRKRLAKFFGLDRLREKFRRARQKKASGNGLRAESAPELGMHVDGGEERGEEMDDEVMDEADVAGGEGGAARSERVWWGGEAERGGDVGGAGMGEGVWW